MLRLLNERKFLPPVEIIAAVVSDALRGLGSAHRATNEVGKPLGIVHRDISPQNVMVGADGVSRLLDFGIAKAADRAQYTREGQIRGKIAYMAPEQLRGTAASARTDLYSMGVVLWESLTARRLFHAPTDAKLVSRVLESDVRPASEQNPAVPPALDALLERALHRHPEVRFQSADEMANALDAAVPPTPRRDVGVWLHGLAGDSLERRARQVQGYVKGFAQRNAAARPWPSEPAPPGGTVTTLLSPGALSTAAPSSDAPALPTPLPERLQTPRHVAPPQPWRAPNLPPPSQPQVAPSGRPSPTSLLVAQGRAWVMPRKSKLPPLAAPLTATPLSTPSAKRRAQGPLLSPLHGLLALATGVVLGGLLARAYLFYRDSTAPPAPPGVTVEIAPPATVFAPTDLPSADPPPPPPRRKGTPARQPLAGRRPRGRGGPKRARRPPRAPGFAAGS
ncbi:MAG TPA: protein kinase, partial [Polyangiaceae bacterium]|nr:protein kinase [Polyangiaceae bacterium]